MAKEDLAGLNEVVELIGRDNEFFADVENAYYNFLLKPVNSSLGMCECGYTGTQTLCPFCGVSLASLA